MARQNAPRSLEQGSQLRAFGDVGREAHIIIANLEGLLSFILSLKRKKKFLKRDFVFRETREMFDILALYLEMKEHLLTNL